MDTLEKLARVGIVALVVAALMFALPLAARGVSVLLRRVRTRGGAL